MDYTNGEYTLETKNEGGRELTYVYLKNMHAEGVEHLMLSGVLHAIAIDTLFSSFDHGVKYTVDDPYVHKDYAKKLIPRAVGYSAGLLDYFFRGKLEISPPDQYVYAVIDGGEIDTETNTQYIRHLKAKVKNITPDEEMLEGSLVAVAKYKKIIGYQPDLSSGSPTAEMREDNYSYSTSAPI
ncbi:MAG: hypothetical protein GY706_15600, partial [Bacteroides sp.]|nr:hypothetical protein [Bacteroides sp.]